MRQRSTNESSLLLSKKLKEFTDEIKYENRNPENVEVLKKLKDDSTNPYTNINKGTKDRKSVV